MYDNVLNILSHVHGDYESPLGVVIDTIFLAAARQKMITLPRVRGKKKPKSWSQKTGPENGPLRLTFDVQLLFRWGRKMATLFVIGKHKKF